MIDEPNPLQISEHHIPPKDVTKNRRGRPSKKIAVQYSQPPKSIISQLLSKMREENTVRIPLVSEECVLDLDDQNDSIESEYEEDKCFSETVKEKCGKEPEKETVPKIYNCDYPMCKYSSKLSTNITKHKRTHTSEKPYLCDRCSFRTNFVNSLKTHRRLHTEERPYQCQHCTYKCNSISNLKKHLHTRHKDEINK